MDDILYENTENAKIKYISFIGQTSNTRFDIAIIYTEHFFGKLLVINLQSGKSLIIGIDDLEEIDYLTESFSINVVEATDLAELLNNYF